jgi:hypothetical protein
MVRVLVILLGAVLAGWAVADVIRTPTHQLRSLPKPAWLAVALVPYVGALVWFGTGRADVPARDAAARRPPPIGPDDDPDFIRRLGGRKPEE